MATITGLVLPVESDVDRVREIYLRRVPGAFWVDFGDFRWFKMETVYNIRFIPDIQNVAQNVRSICISYANLDIVVA